MSTILLVEDAQNLAQVIRRELEAEGYRLVLATDGGQALSLFEQQPPDLVILDWMLPSMDGLEVLRRIRSQAPTPVLMLTARTGETDRVVGLEMGADDYLTKPFGMRELVARVRALLRRVERVQQILRADRERQTGILTYQELGLDPASRRVLLEGEPVDLTRTEFDLVHLLMGNPGRVFGRSYLLEAIWGESYFPGDRSVDNVILRLRKKLGHLGEAVETVWGVGYRLRPME